MSEEIMYLFTDLPIVFDLELDPQLISGVAIIECYSREEYPDLKNPTGYSVKDVFIYNEKKKLVSIKDKNAFLWKAVNTQLVHGNFRIYIQQAANLKLGIDPDEGE